MTNIFFSIFLAFFYSIAYTIAGPMIESQEIAFHRSQLVPFAVCFVVCAVVNIALFYLLPRMPWHKGNGRISQCINKMGNRKFLLITWAFIFVSWIPAYLIFYPGVLSYDMITQVDNALGKIINNHHPVLHTWLIRVFMRLGDSLFSSYEFGLGLLSLVQMITLSYALARMVTLLKKKRLPWIIILMTAFFSAFWFVNVCLSVTMVKDTLHAAFLVLFACHFAEIVTESPEYMERKSNLVFLPIVSFLMCAFRNNGIHIYIFCFAILGLLRIGRMKKVKAYLGLIAIIMLPVVLFKIYTGPVFHALGIEQGQVREALCIPIQQLQRVAIVKADELTEEQTQLMAYYIDDLHWMDSANGRIYDPFIADPAKSCFYSARYEEDPLAFWKFYGKTGIQFTKEYLTAFLSNTLGYWYPGYYGFSYVMYDNYAPEQFVEPLERKSIVHIPSLEKYYESLCSSDFWRITPFLRLFAVSGFSTWILQYGLAIAWRKKGFLAESFPLFLPLIAQYGIMLLSPMSSFRYSWPFYLLLPLTFIAIWEKIKGVKLSEEEE